MPRGKKLAPALCKHMRRPCLLGLFGTYRRQLSDGSRHWLAGVIALWNQRCGNCWKFTPLSAVPSLTRSRRRGAVKPAGAPPAKWTPGSQRAAREGRRDTNVVVCLLLGQAPALWEAELANELWMATRREPARPVLRFTTLCCRTRRPPATAARDLRH